MPQLKRLTLLGRRPLSNLDEGKVSQHQVDIFDVTTYKELINGHDRAICTLGVGQPSKMSKEEFIKIDKEAVIDFAKSCKAANVKHFELLTSVGISATSSSFYLRTKGELVEALKALNFSRLSIFQPFMILTPNNRYGLSQATLLKTWPILTPILVGGLKKYHGVNLRLSIPRFDI